MNDSSPIPSTSGSPSSPREPLLYLPGIDGTGRLLYRQTGLAQRFDVHCASYPQDRDADFDDLLDRASEFLPERPTWVLAESFGGALALALAHRHPELVRGLVLVNTFAYFPRRVRIFLGTVLGPLSPRRPVPRWSRPIRGHFLFDPTLSGADRQAFWSQTSDVPASAYAARIRLIQRLDLRPILPQIQQPTLVVVSPNDRVVPPSAGRFLAQTIPGALLLEMPVGHAAMVHPSVDALLWFNRLQAHGQTRHP